MTDSDPKHVPLFKPTLKGSCHCGLVQFEVNLPDGLKDLSRCNCSICSRRGAIVTSVPLEDFRITKGEDVLTLYQFNTKVAKHYFCSNCGIYTHHQRRSNPQLFAVNIACLKGVRPFELDDIPTTDGINHSSDRAHLKSDQ
ncbi:GFA family protein [Allohahella marinimesophila]|uniref:GFA family protein n=1 Tax=Allohahella marinimesophila TaxID=1054972 RepID=A0ABP7NZM1_9GAMM